MKVEYLIVTNENEPDGFCCNRETFINLLHTDGRIKISGDELIWTNGEEKLTIKIVIETEIIKDKNQRYFLIELINDYEEKIDEFTQLNKALKKIINKLGIERHSLNTLWNDISNTYSNKSYSLINELENLMRKLISKFMIINIGKDWISESMPQNVKKKIDLNEERNELLDDVLHNADFIDLSNFLFEKYRKKDFGQLDNYLSSTKETKVTIQELKNDYLPQSNWDKYFSKIVNKSGDKLKNEWDLLYKIRNKVAHNKLVEKGDFEKIQNYSRSIGDKLHEAINKLSEIKLSPEQKAEFILNLKSPVIKQFTLFQLIDKWYGKYINNIEDFGFQNEDNVAILTITTKDKYVIKGKLRFIKGNSFEADIENAISFSLISDYKDLLDDYCDRVHVIFIFERALNDLELDILNRNSELVEANKYTISEGILVCGFLKNDVIESIEGYDPRW